MSSVELLAFGHSHLGALQQAYVESTKDVPPPERKARFFRLNTKGFQPNFVTTNGKNDLAPDLKQRLKSILNKNDPKVVLLSAMGNGYNTLAMLQHPKPFNFYWPEMDFDETGLEKAEEIPFDLIKTQVKDIADNEALVFWREFNALAKCPIYLLLPPPPVKEESHIRAYPGAFGERVQKYGISPPGLRLKMYMLYMQVLGEAVKGSNTKVIEAPLAALSGGYLAEPYRAHDPTHANAAYGALILDDIRQKAGVEI